MVLGNHVQEVAIKHCPLGGLNKKNVFPLSCGGWKSKLTPGWFLQRPHSLACRCPASCAVPSRPFLWACTFLVCLHEAFRVDYGPPLLTPVNLNYLCKDPDSNIITLRVRASAYGFGGRHNSVHTCHLLSQEAQVPVLP